MGGDTIASGLKLDWTVTRTAKMEFNDSGETSFGWPSTTGNQAKTGSITSKMKAALF